MSAQSSKKKNLFVRIIKVLFILINVVAVLALAGACIAPYVSPLTNAWIPFLGLAFPVLVLVNAAFVLVWVIFNWRWALLSLVAILGSWLQLRTHLQFNGQHNFDESEFPVSVMSYNVRNFDMYNYKPNWEYNFENRNKIMDFLRNENPDILCFQEFVNDLTGEFQTLDTIVKLTDAVNVHAEYTLTSREIIQFGIATFTRFPICGKGRIDFENSSNNLCIYTDVLIAKDTVRIYNAHFESIHFSQQDRDYANGEVEAPDVDAHGKASKRILILLRDAFADRAGQVKTVAEHISTCPYPVILCTDLNDTPASYAYRQLSGELSDAFVASGNGMGSTFAGIFPSFRIDYIFCGEPYEAYNFEARPLDYSDHYPISCDLVKKTE